MIKLLKKLWVMQETTTITKNKNPRLGNNITTLRRINPWNPLSYLVVLSALIVGIVAFGVVGFKKEVDTKNPFKWNGN